METETVNALDAAVAHLDTQKQGLAKSAHEILTGSDDTKTGEAMHILFDERIFEPIATLILNDTELSARVSERMLNHASRPKDLVVAHTFAGVMIERNHDPITAEGHVEKALATNTDWTLAIDRAAWYKSDRGDAVAASRLWRSIYNSGDGQIVALEPYAARPNSQQNRNAPCFCGSGRKFKQCHANAPQREHSLAERVPWISQKIRGYVDRAGRKATGELEDMARVYLVDVEDGENLVEQALEVEPIISDAVIFDGGWLEQFITDRKAILPADEAELVPTWTGVKRSIYSVTSIARDSKIEVKDTRSGDTVTLDDPHFAKHTQKGALVCGRAVPDGESKQFVGGVLPISEAEEKELLAILDEGDAAKFVAFTQRSRTANS